ncbi:thiopurine S-methyltransferase [Chromatiaceae bacterium AAb-1]|nr:thiopurine S-methyltransferase [Chromatiaceae bacterium AAb-1]
MEADFWHQRWQNNELGFHLEEVHPLLKSCLEQVSEQKSEILVPLCGKSLDMLYLSAGIKVIGVELSAIACEQFCTENQLTATVTQFGEYQLFKSGNITLWQGDFFKLPDAVTSSCSLVYDRAALIALPDIMRTQYCRKLAALFPAGATILLLTLEYPEEEKQGPPFCVREEEVKRLFPDAAITLLAVNDLTDKGFAKRRFATRYLIEKAWKVILPSHQ